VSSTDFPGPLWRKSSYSDGQANCVEAAVVDGGHVAVRDNKDPDGPQLRFSPQTWQRFMKACEAIFKVI
jgi:Domain of unknown function (DUF397)